jgi:hypothetical protein
MKKVLLLLTALATMPVWPADAINEAAANSGATNTYRSHQELTVTRKSLGLGTPASMFTLGNEQALFVDDDYYHAPQDMPFYPTAAVIWPRVLELPCTKISGNVVCDGYHWQPALGRAEYLFVVPRVKEVAPPPAPVPPVIIYKEVPRKKKPE